MNDKEILREAQRVLRDHFTPDCPDFDLTCISCQAGRVIQDIEYFIELFESCDG